MLAIALFGFAGFACLCLAMEKHYKELLGAPPSALRLRALRIGGWLLLLTALSLAVHHSGWAMGLVELFAVLMAGVTLWVFLLPYQPRVLLGLLGLSLVLGPVLVLAA
ncbi:MULTISPECIES: DUF3325 domain-containing protein [Pseudomonas]|uniref:DUF3325 domain-containing protein n=1 Tax=Pseudomonas sp. Hg7Tf TaxID=3236988 RepID=A0AB39HYN9_9PSED|nr:MULTISPECIES: DUF3325 domain-containing protein [Pseudomonas]KJK08021.1 membrane protein [Pseudomonas sp. 5]MDD1978470.1 DUF3325 domain-containing protein [Pseudomonas putida]MDH2561361.1 DUF3325 domain-containing protein [Pseudomonas sp. Hg5Tf]QYX47203.1 DUF3325 domain-containing protein [Pseudomonas sp. S11A 273]